MFYFVSGESLSLIKFQLSRVFGELRACRFLLGWFKRCRFETINYLIGVQFLCSKFCHLKKRSWCNLIQLSCIDQNTYLSMELKQSMCRPTFVLSLLPYLRKSLEPNIIRWFVENKILGTSNSDISRFRYSLTGTFFWLDLLWELNMKYRIMYHNTANIIVKEMAYWPTVPHKKFFGGLSTCVLAKKKKLIRLSQQSIIAYGTSAVYAHSSYSLVLLCRILGICRIQFIFAG